VRLDIRRIGPVKEKEDVIGSHVRVKVVKNKVAPPFKQAEFDIMYAEGISHASLVLDIAAEAGIIDKAGAWYSYGTQRIGQGRENAKMYLKDNPVLMAEVEEKVKGILGMKADTQSIRRSWSTTERSSTRSGIRAGGSFFG
jgi:recombination protein RecA